MITEDYVNFETAKLLKEKGFESDECIAIYDLSYDNAFIRDSGIFDNGPEDFLEFQWGEEWRRFGYYLAPTLQMAIKWIRKKGFHIFVPLEIDYDEDERGAKWYHDATYYPEIRRVSDGKIMYDDGRLYANPEQAYEVAIRYCLENLI
jgi:hypothetical protein